MAYACCQQVDFLKFLAVQFDVLNKWAYEFCSCFAGYIKNFEVIDPHRVGKINVELHGRIKDCKALTYRQDLRAKEIEQYRVRMLPTRQVFCLLISMDITCPVGSFILFILLASSKKYYNLCFSFDLEVGQKHII